MVNQADELDLDFVTQNLIDETEALQETCLQLNRDIETCQKSELPELEIRLGNLKNQVK